MITLDKRERDIIFSYISGAFEGRRGHGGVRNVGYRQMTRTELIAVLTAVTKDMKKLWFAERIDDPTEVS
jgi:hypothetical protein